MEKVMRIGSKWGFLLLAFASLLFSSCTPEGREFDNFIQYVGKIDVDEDGVAATIDCDDNDGSIGSREEGCRTGEACLTGGTQCQSGVCEATVCLAPTCDDGIQNGDELDVDCGGGCPTGCAIGVSCNEDWDCESQRCQLWTESPSCVEGCSTHLRTGENCICREGLSGDDCGGCGDGIVILCPNEFQNDNNHQGMSNNAGLLPNDTIRNVEELRKLG